jgi:hypothetical protein
MSRYPSVVIIPTTAPECSITMFVAIVVPWNTWSSADGSSLASAAISRMPCTVPCEGSAGVVGSLCTLITPASSST